MAGSHCKLFRLALFRFQSFQQGSQVRDFTAQVEGARLFMTKRLFQFPHQPHYVAQFALHGKRPLGALLAARDGDVVEAFAGL